jgi:putative membrane protein
VRRLILGTAGNAFALWAAARIVGNVDLSRSWWTVILAALVLTLLNWYVKPAIKLLALPLVIVTLGIALFFISMLMLWLTSAVVSGFDIDGFWPLVKATIIVWIVNMIVEAIFDTKGSSDARPSRRRRPPEAGTRDAP